jgi:hypothetical protein
MEKLWNSFDVFQGKQNYIKKQYKIEMVKILFIYLLVLFISIFNIVL